VRQTEAAPDAAFECKCPATSRSAAAGDGGVIANPGSQWTSGSLRNQVSWRLAVAARRLTNRFRGGGEGDGAFEVRAQLAISDEVEWLGVVWNAVRRSPVTSSIQPRSSIEWTRCSMRSYNAARGGCRPNLDGSVSFEVRPPGPVDFGERAPGEQTDFDGTNHLRAIAGAHAPKAASGSRRRKTRCRYWRLCLSAPDSSRARNSSELRGHPPGLPEARAGRALSQRLESEPRALAQVIERLDGPARYSPAVKAKPGVHQIEQVMRDAFALFMGWFGGADVKAAIDLRRIARQDLAAEFPGKPRA